MFMFAGNTWIWKCTLCSYLRGNICIRKYTLWSYLRGNTWIGKCTLCPYLRGIRIWKLTLYVHVCRNTWIGSVHYAHVCGEYMNGEVYTMSTFTGNTGTHTNYLDYLFYVKIVPRRDKSKDNQKYLQELLLIYFSNHLVNHLNQFLIFFVPVEVFWYSHQQYSCVPSKCLFTREWGMLKVSRGFKIKQSHLCRAKSHFFNGAGHV